MKRIAQITLVAASVIATAKVIQDLWPKVSEELERLVAEDALRA